MKIESRTAIRIGTAKSTFPTHRPTTRIRLLLASCVVVFNLNTTVSAIEDTNTTATPFVIGGTNGTPSDTPEETPWIDVGATMPIVGGLELHVEPAPLTFPEQSPPPSSPDLATNFLAIGDNNTAIPPDTHGAVGTNHIFTMLNTEYRIQTPGGSTIVSGTLSNFWSPIWPFAIQVFDPRVIYDTVNHRWVAAALAGPRTVNSFLLVAVSFDSSPTNGFYYARIKADANSVLWADYPREMDPKIRTSS